ncbi:pentatricopeptide repeat-containing protein At3g29230-like [Rutidosis leptorrhynchoides]|uniref:pentatricopeptide repeat-containing protein At3g29230-like n=1 Tax=Rutidosis leptorrhynchoides TaxID=125765 RepID=UPI003A99D27E
MLNLDQRVFHFIPICTLNQLKQIHGFLITTSLSRNIQIFSKFLRRSTEFGSMDYPNMIFSGLDFGIFSDDQILIWNAMIRGFAFNGPFRNCVQLFDEMLHRGVTPDNYTYPCVLNSCAQVGLHEKGKAVHCQIIKSGFESNLTISSSLFNMYAKTCEGRDVKLTLLRKIFDGMLTRPVEIWNRMIALYVNVGDVKSSRELFNQIPDKDVISWNSMISGYAKTGEIEKARDLFEAMPERNVISWTSMVKAYADAGDLETARKFFGQMPCRNLVSWNCMISSCTQNGKYEEALNLFVQMQSERINADGYTFVSCLTACSNLGALDFGKWIHHYFIEGWSQLGIEVGTALVEMYAQCGDVNKAFTIFVKIGNKDVFCWNVMIKSLAIHGRAEESIKIFYLSQEIGIKPNDFTFSSALFACSHGGLVGEGNKIFLSMEKDYGISPKSEHFCCLIDLFSRNGQIEEAVKVLKNMPYRPDIAIWGALLGGCRVLDDIKSAEKVVASALKSGITEPGVFVQMSNIHALAGQWMEAQRARKSMEERKIWKRAGHSIVLKGV